MERRCAVEDELAESQSGLVEFQSRFQLRTAPVLPHTVGHLQQVVLISHNLARYSIVIGQNCLDTPSHNLDLFWNTEPN